MKAFGSYLERTYAEVLFELADRSQMIDVIKSDLDSWTELCGQEKDFGKFVVSPYFPSEYKQQLVNKILSGRIDDLTMNFLMVVIKHNRVTFLPRIIAGYTRLWEARAGYCPVEVTVARQMSTDETEKLSNDVAEAINRKIKLKMSVNPDIMGGVIIRYDSKVIDNTIRTRLQNAVETILNRGKRRKIDEV